MFRCRPQIRLALALASGLALVAACGGGSDSGGSTPPPPPTSASQGLTQTVPRAGGIVETPDHQVKLVIPPDALDGDTSITVNQLDKTALPAGVQPAQFNLGPLEPLKVVQFGPDGLDFAKPVQLTIKYDAATLPAGTNAEQILIAKVREDGLLQLAKHIRVDTVNHSVTVEITSFSTYAVIGPHPPISQCVVIDETLNDDLRVDDVTDTSITLSWTTIGLGPGCSDNPVFYYLVQGALAAVPDPSVPSLTREPRDSDYSNLSRLVLHSLASQSASGRLTAKFGSLQSGVTYRFRIQGLSLAWQYMWPPVGSVLATTLANTAPRTPAAPNYFAAAWDDAYAAEFFPTGAVNSRAPRVRLNWTPVPEAQYYRILRREASELLYSEIRQVRGAVSAYDSNVVADRHYFYRVTAFNGNFESTFVERDVVPLGSQPGNPAFRICTDSNQVSLLNGGHCDWPPTPFHIEPGGSTTIRLQVAMIPLLVSAPSVNPASCEIRFAVFNASGGVLPAQVGAFAPEPLLHVSQTGLLAYAVDLRIEAAADASLGIHGLTLYATGCRGTIARQPLLVDVNPVGTRRVSVRPLGNGQVTSQPAGIQCPPFCFGYFALNSMVNLTANPNASWQGDCQQFGPTGGTLLVDADKRCDALFATGGFFDTTFNDNDWTMTTYAGGNGGMATGVQVTNGGNPGSFRSVRLQVNAGPLGATSSVLSFHWKTGAVYDPAVSGAITSIDYTQDAKLISGGGAGQGTSVALLQDGKAFYAAPAYVTTPASQWTMKQYIGLVASDFVHIDSSANATPLHPDFSPQGKPIQFGFFRANSTAPSGNGYTTEVGIDNWLVTVH